MSQTVYGRVINYRIGIRTQMSNESLIEFGQTSSEAPKESLIGKKVLWKSGKSEFRGSIVGFHGKNGVVRVKFKKGLPGQALGDRVELV